MQRVLGGRSPGPKDERRYFWLGMLADDFLCFVKMIFLILISEYIDKFKRLLKKIKILALSFYWS